MCQITLATKTRTDRKESPRVGLYWNLNLRPHGSQPTSLTTESHPWVCNHHLNQKNIIDSLASILLSCHSFDRKFIRNQEQLSELMKSKGNCITLKFKSPMAHSKGVFGIGDEIDKVIRCIDISHGISYPSIYMR